MDQRSTHVATASAAARGRGKSWDVLALGCVAVDEFLCVEEIPPPDAKAEVLSRARHCGGLAATALVAAARLGARCAYAGVLGDDPLSQFACAALEQEGISLAHLELRPDCRPIHSTILVDQQGRRTILYDLDGVVGPDGPQPAASLLADTRVLLIDQLGSQGMVRAARLARAAGAVVVADFESEQCANFAELLAEAEHLILGEDFARRITGAADGASAAAALWDTTREVVVVTSGANGCFVRDAANTTAWHVPAFAVTAVDTTGCGDVFHGAYAAALAQGLDLPVRLRWASAAAALKATRPGGQAGIPNRAALEAFLKELAK